MRLIIGIEFKKNRQIYLKCKLADKTILKPKLSLNQ